MVVELDGRAAHGTPAQIERDHERDMRLRTAGFIVLRYTWRQVVQRSTEVLADLAETLAQRGTEPSANPGAGIPRRIEPAGGVKVSRRPASDQARYPAPIEPPAPTP